MRDQPVAGPLSEDDNTNTEWTHTGIHASSGIGTHDCSVRADEDSSYLRPRGHCSRQVTSLDYIIYVISFKYTRRIAGVTVLVVGKMNVWKLFITLVILYKPSMKSK
jgi:hypothetical protein